VSWKKDCVVRIEKYGPGSEKLSDDQLELLELEPGASSTEVEAESQRQQLELPLKKGRKHPGRQQFRRGGLGNCHLRSRV
jgi:hypothetical protein